MEAQDIVVDRARSSIGERVAEGSATGVDMMAASKSQEALKLAGTKRAATNIS